jgi:putative FmdB family regulatory protein
MPTYVYACDSCGKQFEQFQSFKDEPLTVCRCGAEGKVRRVIQPAGVVFKGSGWYINDSRGTSSSSVGVENDKAAQPASSTSNEKSSTSESAPASSDA